jgi:hypothetical protein
MKCVSELNAWIVRGCNVISIKTDTDKFDSHWNYQVDIQAEHCTFLFYIHHWHGPPWTTSEQNLHIRVCDRDGLICSNQCEYSGKLLTCWWSSPLLKVLYELWIDNYMWQRMVSSGMLRHVALVRTDILEELSTSFIRMKRIDELGTTLGVTSNWCTLWRNIKQRASVASYS